MFQANQSEIRKLFYRVRFSVLPNEVGLLYRKNRFEQKLESGIYNYFDYGKQLNLLALSLANRLQTILNQEVLTKDNVALRFSYFVEYRIENTEKFVEKIDVFSTPYNAYFNAEQVIHNLSQVTLRKIISEIDSQELNEKRNEILPETPKDLQKELSEYGVGIVRILIKDITFPKQIQDLFAKQLEAKIRAKTDLENARTQVAAARALKNASELMKGDENIKFLQFMETITKISEKGKHTFVIGDARQLDGK
jgi:regulator of protease activity HflC (stomatin/prohibitin superfamily)